MDLSTLVSDAFEYYRAFNETHPVSASMLTAGVIFPSADVTSQLITTQKVDWNKVRYTASLSPIYGMISYAVMQTGHIVENYISDNPLAMSALGPCLFGNVQNLFFFVNNTVGDKKKYQLDSLVKHYTNLSKGPKSAWQNINDNFFGYIPRKEYTNAFIGTVTFWNAFQYLNFSYVSEELQTPASLGVSLAWTVLLSWWSLTGGRKIA